MKVSVNWLRELVRWGDGASSGAHDAAGPTWQEIADRLVSAGFEVEGAVEVGGGFTDVVVVEVRSFRLHPQADNLKLVDVFDGKDVVQVVCGAPVIPAVGSRVAWARPGSRLPGGRTIAPREIRGVTSPGMLCAEDELGLGDSHAGLLVLDATAAPGSDAAAALGGSDRVLEVNVTPNRPDGLGHRGIAREVAALFPGAVLRPADVTLSDAMIGGAPVDTLARVELRDPVGCPRFTARVLTDVTVGQSPLGVRLRLASLGVRAINDVVDATNLAMLETGQPLHAYDLDQLARHTIVVRPARAGETLVTLDGVERQLSPEDLLICDAERPVALAGVMGGEGSGVSPTTRRLLLESAYFDPTRVRRSARRHGLHTEASHRFERGADPNAGVEHGSLRCTRQLLASTGGRLANGSIDVYPRPIVPVGLALRPTRTRRVLGIDLATDEQLAILRRLELGPVLDGDVVRCQVPTFRPDLTREVDLVEEVARIHGFDRIPATLPRTSDAPARRDPPLDERMRDALSGLGLAEHIGYGFSAPERFAALGFPEGDVRRTPLRLANPLGEELSAMRTTLVPGLLAVARDNHARGVDSVRLFEVGTVFYPQASPHNDRLPDERLRAAGVLTGTREDVAAEAGGWRRARHALDFFDVKGIVEALLERFAIRGVSYRTPLPEAPWLHPGAGAAAVAGERFLGAFGEVHPEVRRRLGVEERCFAFELDLEALVAGQPAARGEPWRFPGSSRDISFFVDAAVSAADIGDLLAGGSPLVAAVTLLEDYRAAGHVPEGKKGMLFSVGYRAADRTLTDEEVNREHARILAALAERFAITAR